MIDVNESGDPELEIVSGTCDLCGNQGPGVVHRFEGGDVMFDCEACSPLTFERVARIDIDAWLAGGKFHGHDGSVDRRGLTP